jgi:hypothetical protein
MTMRAWGAFAVAISAAKLALDQSKTSGTTPLSQYPYSTPPQPFQPNYSHYSPTPGAHPTLARAALFLFIIGGLTTLGGFCFSAVMAVTPLNAMEEALAQQQKSISEPIPFTAGAMKTTFVILFVGLAIVGVIHFALGFGVRKGNMPAIVSAVIITGLSLLLLLLFVFLSLLTIAINPMAGAFDVLLTGLPTVAMVFQFIALIKARSVAARGPMSPQQQQQHQMQMWQQQQQMQQAYSQQGGYAAPGMQNPPGYTSGYGYGTPQPQQPAQPPAPYTQQTPPGGSDVPPRQE